MSKINSTSDEISTNFGINYIPCWQIVFEKYILRFDIGDSVYLKTDPEQCERLVTGINIRQNGVSYALSHLTNESYHYDFEITKERDVIKAMSA